MAKKNPVKPKWTLVQHSGYSVAGNAQFIFAVEEVMARTKQQQERVRNAGGLLFDSYVEASDAAMTHNYPKEVGDSLIPHVRGGFSNKKIEGMRIYVPKEEA